MGGNNVSFKLIADVFLSWHSIETYPKVPFLWKQQQCA